MSAGARLEMILLADIYLAGGIGIGLGVGALLVFIVLRWKEQTLRKARDAEAQSIVETARREADSVLRETRLRASEDALKLRQETEQSFAGRARQIAETEARLTERENIIARQLDGLTAQETSLRSQTEEVQRQNIALETQQQELTALGQQRLAALASTAKLSETEARAQLLKEVEQQAQGDANAMSRRILEEAKERAEERPAGSLAPRFSVTPAATPTKARARRWPCPTTTSKAASSGARGGTSAPLKPRPA